MPTPTPPTTPSNNAPVRTHDAIRRVREAIESGLVVHAAHPDFDGIVTAGRYHRAVGGSTFALIHHGVTTCDVTDDETFDSVAQVARVFVYQVGKRNAYAGAVRAIERAS